MGVFIDFPDTYQTMTGASRLAEMIRLYWANRGSAVDLRIEKARASIKGNIFCVRSDMVGGKPRTVQS